MDISKLKFDQNGLIPAVIQDNVTQQVLMVGWMNAIALEKTLETGLITFWSRSRNKLWTKGESSGNYLSLQKLFVDCDQDTVLYKVEQVGGAACHTGYESCFHRKVGPDGTASVVGVKVFDPEKVYGR